MAAMSSRPPQLELRHYLSLGRAVESWRLPVHHRSLRQQHRRMQSVAAAAPKKQSGGGGSGGRAQGGGKTQRGFGDAGGNKRGSGSSGGGGGGSGGGSKGSSGQGGGGKGSDQKRQQQGGSKPASQQQQTVKAPPPAQVSGALQHKLLDELSGWEPAPAPLWGTFCGHLEGEWLGQYAAYTPWGGDPEPVWADEKGRYLLHAYSRTTEGRDAGHQEGDLFTRTTRRGAYLSELLAPTPAAATAAGDQQQQQQEAGAASSGGGGGGQDDEAEGFGYNVDGAVVFDGGAYSVGPLDLGDLLDEEEEGPWADGDAAFDGGDGGAFGDGPSVEQLLDALPGGAQGLGDGGSAGDEDDGGVGGEDDDGAGEGEEDAELAGLPVSTVVVEQALVQGGQQRRRLVATLKLRRPPGGEIDVEVARMLLYVEHWSGPTAITGTPAAAAPLQQPPPSQAFGTAAPQLPRPAPGQLVGAWNAFGVSAAPVREEDPLTGEARDVRLYMSREERQEWAVPGYGAAGDGGGGDDGGSLWLPGGCVVTFRMVPDQQAAAGAASSNGSSSGSGSGDSGGNGKVGASRLGAAVAAAPAPRGIIMSFAWLIGEGTCLTVEREYTASGALREVRHSSAVRGGWSGGRM